MKTRILDDAAWREELEKEAPRDYVKGILYGIFPDSWVECCREEQVSGMDWRVHFPKTGELLEVDDKNDRHLGYTGNINLDEATLEKKGTIQLFVNHPDFMENYLLVYNNYLPLWYVKDNCRERIARKQEWGDYTYSYVIEVNKIRRAVPQYPKFAHPSFEWFTIKRKKNT